MRHRVLVAGLAAFVAVAAIAATVTRVGIAARPRSYAGPCPATLVFTGTIHVNRWPVMVEYQWERSDGAASRRRRMQVRASGQGVRDNWTLGRGRERLRVWERLHVLAPTNMVSPTAQVNVTCR